MALLTVRAAAEQLGVAYSTLKRWVHTGHVRTTRTEGGRIASPITRSIACSRGNTRRAAAGLSLTDESLGGLSAGTACTGSSTKCASMACSHRSACVSAISRSPRLSPLMPCGAQAAPRGRRAGDHQVDRSHDRACRPPCVTAETPRTKSSCRLIAVPSAVPVGVVHRGFLESDATAVGEYCLGA